MLNNCIPPKNIIAANIDVHPAGIPGLIIFLMIKNNKYIDPIIERNNPETLEILKGCTEKFVNPIKNITFNVITLNFIIGYLNIINLFTKSIFFVI